MQYNKLKKWCQWFTRPNIRELIGTSYFIWGCFLVALVTGGISFGKYLSFPNLLLCIFVASCIFFIFGAWVRWRPKESLPTLAILLTSIATIIIAQATYRQADSSLSQTKIIARKFELENRPYFYTNPNPSVDFISGRILAGVLVEYGNHGNYFARDIEISGYKLFSSYQEESYPVENYWEEVYGGLQEYNSVPPNTRTIVRDCRADMGVFKKDDKIYIQFSMRAFYNGSDMQRNTRYQYGVDYIYLVDARGQALPMYRKDYFDNEEIPPIKNLIYGNHKLYGTSENEP